MALQADPLRQETKEFLSRRFLYAIWRVLLLGKTIALRKANLRAPHETLQEYVWVGVFSKIHRHRHV